MIQPCAEAKLYNLFAVWTVRIFTRGPQQRAAGIGRHQPNAEDRRSHRRNNQQTLKWAILRLKLRDNYRVCPQEV